MSIIQLSLNEKNYTKQILKQEQNLFVHGSCLSLFNVELFPNPADFGQSWQGYGKVAESLEFGGWEEKHVSAKILAKSKLDISGVSNYFSESQSVRVF